MYVISTIGFTLKDNKLDLKSKNLRKKRWGGAVTQTAFVPNQVFISHIEYKYSLTSQ